MTKTNHLDAWLAQEQTIRAVLDAGAGPGVARPDQIAGKTGLALMQAMLQGELPYPSIAQTWTSPLSKPGMATRYFKARPVLRT